MGKTIVFGPDAGVDDPATTNLDIQLIIGLGSTRRYDDVGNPIAGSFNSVTITGLNYIVGSAANIAALNGVDGNDALIGTDSGDLVVWERSASGLGSPRYLLPAGGTAAVDLFDLRGGDDVINLTYFNDQNPNTFDSPYSANATIFGGLGNDVVWSGQGNDIIGGGGGVTAGGPGNETLFGGGGNDEIYGSVGAFNNMSGDSGNDTLFGGANNDGMGGGDGSDTLFGGSGQDNVLGDAGNDTLYGGAGNDVAFGGDDTDIVFGDAGADTIDGGIGFLDTLYGGADGDSVTDADGAKFATGGAGNDVVSIGFDATWNAGLSTIAGGDGNDTIIFTGAQNSTVTVVVSGDDVTSGNDTVSARGSYTSAVATLGGGGDVYGYLALSGSNGARVDTVYGGAGNDVLDTSVGNDFLFGGDDNDTLIGGAGADSLYGGNGIDAISYSTSSAGVTIGLTGVVGIGGDAQGDVAWTDIENLTGSNQGDSLYGNASDNTILGLGGNDTIEGRGGADSLDGGAGINWLSYSTSNGPVSVNLGTGVAVGGHATGDVFANFQNLQGSAFDDILSGDGSANSLVGSTGDDTLTGAGGLDTLFGGAGNDRFILNTETGFTGSLFAWDGETGSAPAGFSPAGTAIAYVDLAFGGADTDMIDIRNQSDAAALQGRQTVYSPGNSNIGGFVAGIELIAAGAAVDVINLTYNDGTTRTAYAENLTIMGGGAGDVVFSGSGNDLIVGGLLTGSVGAADGADLLYGGQGDDTIFGDDQDPLSLIGGNDTLFGGRGNDTIDAGVGNDTIYGGASTDTLFGGAGDDLIFNDVAGNAFGGDGSDLIVMNFSSPASSFTITGGVDNVATDGADSVFVAGGYARIDATLGAGQDRYIASSTDSGSAQIDRVFGETGNDLISTWYGNDLLDGGGASDALWGGAGSDTIYGGGGTDYLYGGAGNNDVINGGAGTDYYYWSRTDGQNDQIFDDFRGTAILPGQQADNVLIVFPDFDPTEVNGDGLRTGSGVFEVDHDLNDLAGGNDMVRLTDIDGAGGTMWRMTVLTGDGATNYVEFDQRDVQTILLWNNDAAPGTNVIQTYAWDPIDARYEFVS